MSDANPSPQPKACKSVAALALLGLAATGTYGYTYNNLGSAGGWDDVEKGSSVTYVLDRSDYTQDLGLGEAQITGVLRSAFSTWGSVEGSSLNFTEKSDEGGNYDLTDGPGDSAGPPWFGGYAGDSLDQNANYLYANITIGGWLPNSYFDYLEDGVINNSPSNILAVTWTGKVKGSLSRKPRWIADIFFNDAWTWSLNGDDPATGDYEIDIETVLLHELGHAIGLGHDDDVPSVMGTYYTGIQRDLYGDDEAGVLSLYTEKAKGRGKPPWAKGKGSGSEAGLAVDNLELYRSWPGGEAAPEPGTLLLCALGLVGLNLRSRKRN